MVAIGSAFIDRVPPWLKDLAIAWFGTNDKTALRVGILIVLLALAAVGGFSRYGAIGPARLITVVLAGVAVAAAATRPDSGPDRASSRRPSPGSRRLLILQTVLAATRAADSTSPTTASAAGASCSCRPVSPSVPPRSAHSARIVGGNRAAVADARAALDLPKPPTLDPPAGVQADGATPWVTPNDDFYRIDTALSVPQILPSDWKLRIHGMVERELELTFDDLLKRQVMHKWVTLTCVSNEVGGDLIGNALWSGVLLKDLLDEAGPSKDADAIQSTSKDGFTAGTPLSTLLDDRQSMLAFAMNGQPLPVEHGFPVRIVVPGLYGYVSATKWLTDIEVTRFDQFEAYWTPRGWSELGPIKLSSRIDVPFGKKVTAGPVTVAGVAWDQHVGVSKVEVRVDGGPWQQATLADGCVDRHLAAVALDLGRAAGQPRPAGTGVRRQGQPADRGVRPARPNGSTGLHTVNVPVD